MQLSYKNTIIELDEQDLPVFNSRIWRFNGGYLYNCNVGFFHRLIFPPPNGLLVDHINQNKLDNRRCNLRHVTKSVNNRNSKERKSLCGCRGVYMLRNGHFQVRFGFDGKIKNFGTYDTFEDARTKATEVRQTISA